MLVTMPSPSVPSRECCSWFVLPTLKGDSENALYDSSSFNWSSMGQCPFNREMVNRGSVKAKEKGWDNVLLTRR